MPIVDYPFQAQGTFSEPKPILPIKITNPHNDFVFFSWGLIDTGADSTAIPGWIAKKLGHDIKSGKLSDCIAGGGLIRIYEHTCCIDILSMDKNGRVDDNNMAITIPDGRIGVLEHLPFVLLGVNDFLRNYVLTIDYPKQVFSIRQQ